VLKINYDMKGCQRRNLNNSSTNQVHRLCIW